MYDFIKSTIISMCYVSLFYFVTLWKEKKRLFSHMHSYNHTRAHTHTPRDKSNLTLVHQMYVIVVELFDTTPFENHCCVFFSSKLNLFSPVLMYHLRGLRRRRRFCRPTVKTAHKIFLLDHRLSF